MPLAPILSTYFIPDGHHRKNVFYDRSSRTTTFNSSTGIATIRYIIYTPIMHANTILQLGDEKWLTWQTRYCDSLPIPCSSYSNAHPLFAFIKPIQCLWDTWCEALDWSWLSKAMIRLQKDADNWRNDMLTDRFTVIDSSHRIKCSINGQIMNTHHQ
jgi:hypothetical protein